MIEYKFISKSEIAQEYTAKNRKSGEKIEVRSMSMMEQLNAVIDKLQELGQEGWKYAETFKDFDAYLLTRQKGKKWRYNLVNISVWEKNARTMDDQMKNVLEGMSDLGKEGWEYVTCLYIESPAPRLEILLVKEDGGKSEPKTAKSAKDE